MKKPLLLSMTLFLCIPIRSMEKQIQLVTQPELPIITEHAQSLATLYDMTRTMLDTTRVTGIVPPVQLLTIINQTHELKQKNVTEQLIGDSFYHKPPLSQVEKASLCMGLALFSNNITNYNIAVFMNRLKIYHELITKNDFVTPTQEQYELYLDNKQKGIRYALAIQRALTFGIDLAKTNTHEKIAFTTIPKNVAAQELDQLIEHIQIMVKEKQNTIKYSAELLYDTNISDDTVQP